MNQNNKKLPHIGKRPRNKTHSGKSMYRSSISGRPRKNYYAIKQMNRRKRLNATQD